MLRFYAALPLLFALTSCSRMVDSVPAADAAPAESAGGATFAPVGVDSAPAAPTNPSVRPANLLGRIPVLEYHLIGETNGRWQRSREDFRRDLELLYARKYRPISVSDLVDKRIDLPAGYSPVVFTFDDASPSQFRFLENGGELEVDPTSAIGIWFEFRRQHPDWPNRAVFCMLSGAEAGRSFFGDNGIEGQKSEWRHRKLRVLVDSGFELCNHTVWHANLAKQTDAMVTDQIARLNLAVDSAVPRYKVRTFALPLGEWPRNRELARNGSWTDPKSGRATSYHFDAILQVSGGLARSPHDPQFDAMRIPRVQVFDNELQKILDRLDRDSSRFVSDGARHGR